eukprot:scaffold108940_cov57-Phaeocystis_antarctica.AAC.1
MADVYKALALAKSRRRAARAVPRALLTARRGRWPASWEIEFPGFTGGVSSSPVHRTLVPGCEL